MIAKKAVSKTSLMQRTYPFGISLPDHDNVCISFRFRKDTDHFDPFLSAVITGADFAVGSFPGAWLPLLPTPNELGADACDVFALVGSRRRGAVRRAVGGAC